VIDGASHVTLLFHDVFVRDPGESGFRSPAADRYKLALPEFELHLAALQRLPSTAMPFSLTFDDGGESYYTRIADRLERLGWRARCFVPTNFIDRPGFLTRRQLTDLDARGHQIGAHSASHPPRMSACSPEVLRDEWRKSVDVLQDLLGRPVQSASVPGGYYSTAVAEAAAAAGIRTLFTSEPLTRPRLAGGCSIHGRFAIRQYDAPAFSARLAGHAPWARWQAWADWNSKAFCKVVLGSSYSRVADWVMSRRTALP
jgi:peptidoglycan/xylan/chitin deacetylase (PgdA/CDA1 family)